MQVFITNKNLRISAMELDDLRLGANIKEGIQLLCGMENLDCFVKDKNVKIGHSNHPIFTNYHEKLYGIEFLVYYIAIMCEEYYYRFGKQNQAYFTIQYFLDKYLTTDEIIDYDDNIKGTLQNPVTYIKGQKGINQVVDNDNPYELYRNLLIDKWDNDIKPPKWTNRNRVVWYKGKGGEYEK